MLKTTNKWSHTRGNTVVPYRWQVTLEMFQTRWDG